ncbi:hypothetical protein RN607_05470 [Demequina capsici]|uniref:Terminase small subunit n=1 Tax=Demequina capsici TaxID=3075620 RepID=A0AA96FHA2_9MICO|nr:hypothetical protein [Demequina sp. PMTSA13]WNM28451.1 hypothetical protein RN607_05470 [Demequina sp. PMTSA13]
MTDPTDPPAGLGTRGAAFWTATLAAYELTDSETAMLLEACRTLDNLDALAEAIQTHGVMVTGSMGQPVVNAALTEVRGQRLALHRLLTALALPDEDGEALPSARSAASQAANSARWQGHTSERALRAVERP